MIGPRASTLSPESLADLLNLYYQLHAHPELSLHEFATSALMAQRLDDLGYLVHTGIGGTGVVGVLSNGDGPTIVLRADMDALPVAEQTGLDYASNTVGTDATGRAVPVMHACGHDAHMVSMLGAAAVLSTTRERWRGTLVIVFQPAEEVALGAAAMVSDGLFDLFPRPTVILGQHVGNLPAGVLSFTRGPAMAAADSLRVVITGRGAHGSRPQAAIDPVLIAASIVVRLQSIVAREIAPTDIAVVTVGSINAGSAANIIPSTAELTINLRSLTPSVRSRLLAAVARIVEAECAAAAVEEPPTIETIGAFPRLVNDPITANRAVAALRLALGDASVREVAPITISEDFGLLAEAVDVPSFFWFFGSSDPAAYSAAEARDEVDRLIPANHSALFAPVPAPTITSGIDALLIAFGAFAELTPN